MKPGIDERRWRQNLEAEVKRLQIVEGAALLLRDKWRERGGNVVGEVMRLVAVLDATERSRQPEPQSEG